MEKILNKTAAGVLPEEACQHSVSTTDFPFTLSKTLQALLLPH